MGLGINSRPHFDGGEMQERPCIVCALKTASIIYLHRYVLIKPQAVMGLNGADKPSAREHSEDAFLGEELRAVALAGTESRDALTRRLVCGNGSV